MPAASGVPPALAARCKAVATSAAAGAVSWALPAGCKALPLSAVSKAADACLERMPRSGRGSCCMYVSAKAVSSVTTTWAVGLEGGGRGAWCADSGKAT